MMQIRQFPLWSMSCLVSLISTMALADGTPPVISADHVLLTPEAEALENRILCSLISEEFVGSVVTLYFETASEAEFRVQKQQRELDALNLQIGETVWASWETQHAYLLPEV